MTMQINTAAVPAHLVGRVNAYNAAVGAGSVPADIQSLIQEVLRESYIEMNNDLQEYAMRVKHYNAQKKAIREQLTNMRNIAADLAGAEDEDPINSKPTGTGGTSSSSSSYTDSNGQPISVTSAEQRSTRYPEMDAQVRGIVNLASNPDHSGRTPLEQAVMDGTLSSADLAAAIPYMTHDELKMVIAAFGGSDMHVHDSVRSVWSDIINAMTPEQVVGLKADSRIEGQEFNFGWFRYNTGFDLWRGDSQWKNALDMKLGTARATLAQQVEGGAGMSDADLVAAYSAQNEASYKSWEQQQADEAAAREAAQQAAQENAALNTGGGDGEARDLQRALPTEIGPPSGDDFDLDPSDGSMAALRMKDGVWVQDGTIGTKAELDANIKALEEDLASVGEDAQLANVDLQNALQKQQQTLQLMSNVSKMLHDTGMSIIRKIGG